MSEQLCYLGIITRLLIRPPGIQTRMRVDKLFAELRRAVPKLNKRTARHNSWISEETWRLVDKRVSARREPRRDQRRLRQLGVGYQGITQGIQATAGEDGGRGGGNPIDRGSPPTTRSLEEDAGVVSRSGRPLPAAFSGYTQADHGGS